MAAKRLLIADDDRIFHGLYVDHLGPSYEYLHAYNGADALILAVDLVPDLVILDIMMPLLDGRTVCRKIREYPKTRGIKVVMVSGKDGQFDRALGFEVGADEYLEKAHALTLLPAIVEKQLRGA